MNNCNCCGILMTGRSDQRYCSSTCRQKASRSSRQHKQTTVCSLSTCNNKYTQNRKTDMFCSKECKAKAVDNQRMRKIYNMTFTCAETYYKKMPNRNRIEYILSILECALTNNDTRMMLTNPKMLKPDLQDKKLFWRTDSSNYKTIPEIVNSFCFHFYGVSVTTLLKEKNIDIYKDIDYTADTRFFDLRGFWKGTKETLVLEDETIEERMKGRVEWLTDYLKNIHAAKRNEVVVENI